MDKWTPAATGSRFALSEILAPLEPFKQQLCVVSGLAHAPVAPWTGEDTGGAENHVRAAAVFLSGAHPVKGDRAIVGPSVDQLAAAHVGQDTPLPSVELSIEEVGLNCDANFTCAYRNTLAWKSATLPLPMENNPQVAFERLFGDGSTDARARGAPRRGAQPARLRDRAGRLAAHRAAGRRPQRGSRDYLDEVREVERRVQNVDARLSAGIELPEAPVGVPDTFEEHLNVMFDLQVLAYRTEITRISTLMLARENSNARVSRQRRARGLPQRVAPFERAQEHGPVRGHQPLSRQDADVFLGQAALDARRRRHAARSLADPVRQQLERRQRAQLRSAARAARGRRLGPAPRRPASALSPPHTPMANLLLAMLHKLGAPVDSIGDSTEPLAI